MPITYKHGSIFDSEADVLVCPVNCVGVMGKGLALEFKRRFPRESAQFLSDYRRGWGISPGNIAWYCKRIGMAATKDHWRDPSKTEWVEDCLKAIVHYQSLRKRRRQPLNSIAIPQLGCGCGGLDWKDVEPLYHKHLGDLDANVEVWIYDDNSN